MLIATSTSYMRQACSKLPRRLIQDNGRLLSQLQTVLLPRERRKTCPNVERLLQKPDCIELKSLLLQQPLEQHLHQSLGYLGRVPDQMAIQALERMPTPPKGHYSKAPNGIFQFFGDF